MSYTLNHAEKKSKFDEVVDSNVLKILIEPAALMHKIGTHVDYLSDRLKSEFTFMNPI